MERCFYCLYFLEYALMIAEIQPIFKRATNN